MNYNAFMNIKISILFIILLMFNNAVFAEHIHPEKYYQTIWCNANDGIMEYKLKDETRVDCLTNNYAVEFDFAKKWAEAIGQSLYYGKMTGKQPTIVLIIEKPNDLKYYYRILPLCIFYRIKLFKMS